MARRILLTGGAGYIGSHTFAALAAAGYDPVILDDFSNARRSVPERLGRITGRNAVACHEASVLDLATLVRILRDEAIEGVVHFAALKAAGESMERPLDYVHVNVGGLTTLLRAMAAAGIGTLVFSSSATVYGVPKALPIAEDAPRSYANPYGFTKLACEQILEQAAAADPSWRFGVLRYFNPAGAHPSGLIGEDPADTPNNLMPYIARVAAGELPHLNVFGDDYDTPDGTGIRDYIHVEDLARGHVLSLNALFRDGRGHVVNLGTGRGYSVMEMLAAYGRACGRDLPYRVVPRRQGDIAACWADPARAKAVLGFEARLGLDDMCRSSWHWIRTGAREAASAVR